MTGDVTTVTTDDPTPAPAAVDNESAAPAAGSTPPGGTPPDEGVKAGEGDQAAAVTYADFALPEGMELNAEILGKAEPLFKKYNISKEDAQEFVNLYASEIQAGSQKQVDAFNQLMDDWRTKSSNDPEFGGDKFEENIKTARLAIDKYGTPELKQLLEEHGVGNHPEVVRFMVRVGSKLREDVPGNPGGVPTAKKDRVSILYPSESTA